MDQDCVDAAIMSDALPQDTEAIERELKAKIFCCSSLKTHLCVTKRIVLVPFQKFGTIRNAQYHAK